MRKDHAPWQTFAEETAELLVSRVRVAAVIAAAGTFAFEVVDLLGGRVTVALHMIKLVQLVLLGAMVWFVRGGVSRRRALAITVLTVCFISLGAVLGGLVGYEADTTFILLTVITMTAAAAVPWGLGPQTVVVVFSAAAMGFAAPWMVDMPHEMVYPTVALSVAFGVSLYFAWVFEAFRRARWEAQHALALSEERLAGEAETSAALARVGREMIASLDQPVLLDRLCALTMETMGAKCSHTLLRDQQDHAWVLVSSAGHPAAECDLMRGAVLPDTLLRRLLPSGGEDVALVPFPRELGGYCASATLACMPLHRGDEVTGIHVAAFRNRRTLLTRDEERLAAGIARFASMALANASVVEELERNSRLKSEFVSTVSHEIRTPLNVMLGFLEMVEDPAFETVERTELTGRIKTVAHELHDLVESTLEIARMEARKGHTAFERVALPSFWQALNESCDRFRRRDGVVLEWGPAPDVIVRTEPKKLGIVVRNLVGNAVKFTERGFVRVTAELGDDALLLHVEDSGLGIPPDEQATVFQMFHQASGTEPGRRGGSGFGLYIVRTFVEQLGGTVTLESAPGVGSRFTVALPLGPRSMEPRAATHLSAV